MSARSIKPKALDEELNYQIKTVTLAHILKLSINEKKHGNHRQGDKDFNRCCDCSIICYRSH
jgi:hypothetical protein